MKFLLVALALAAALPAVGQSPGPSINGVYWQTEQVDNVRGLISGTLVNASGACRKARHYIEWNGRPMELTAETVLQAGARHGITFVIRGGAQTIRLVSVDPCVNSSRSANSATPTAPSANTPPLPPPPPSDSAETTSSVQQVFGYSDISFHTFKRGAKLETLVSNRSAREFVCTVTVGYTETAPTRVSPSERVAERVTLTIPSGTVSHGSVTPRRRYAAGPGSTPDIECRPTSSRVFLQRNDAFGNRKVCIDVNEGSISPGAKVTLWTCHGGLNQQWILPDHDGQILGIGSQCLTAEQTNVGEAIDPTKQSAWQLRMRPCAGQYQQRWGIRGDAIEAKWMRPPMCVSAIGLRDGATLGLFRCAGAEGWKVLGTS